MKRISMLMILATLVLTAGRKYPDGWQFVPLPAEDEYATNRFGRSWLEPVYNGYLIVSNRYIEAPYVVEQRGFVIFVNNERIEDGTDIRLVSPVPPETPVTEDPGVPQDVTATTSLDNILFHPVCVKKQLYWNHLGIYGEERFHLAVEYYKQLPCIKEVVDEKRSVMDDRLVTLVDRQGHSSPLILQTSPKKSVRTATDPEMYGHIVGALGGRARDLRDEMVFYIRNGSNPGGSGAVWETNRWIDVFNILVSDMTISQKVERISATRAMGSSVSDHTIRTMLPVDGFIATPQLWQRLSNDMSWTNDAPARLLALTNGWQKILPAFMRTQTVTVATTATGVKSDPHAGIARTQTELARQTSVPSARSSDTPPPVSSGANGRIWFAVASVGVLVLLLFLTRHLFRKWNRDHSR